MSFSKIVSLTLVVALLLVVGVSTFGAEKQIIIKLGHGDSADESYGGKHNGAMTFKRLVESKSGGRIKVEVYPDNQLGAPREMFESVKMGSMQIVWDGSSNFTGFVPEFMVFSIPYTFPNVNVALDVLNGQFGKDLSALSVQKAGVRLLAYTHNGWRNFTNNKRPIKTPADLKGLKIRTQEDPAMMKIVTSLGGSATPISWSELYTSLQQGVVDGEENPTSMIQVAKLYEVQKYMTLDGHIFGVNPICINEKFYQGLPSDLRAVVAESARTAALVYNGLVEFGAGMDIEDLEKKGMQIYVPTAAERQLFIKGTAPVKDFVISKIGATWPNKLLKAIEAASK